MATVDGKIDTQRMEKLKRFSSPIDPFNSWLASDAKIREGAHKAFSPPPDLSPEQLSAWKGERGLPIQASDYEVPLAAGQKPEELNDNQKAVISDFQKLALDLNLTKDQAAKIAVFKNAIDEKTETEKIMRDAAVADKIEDALRAEWGPLYRNNITQTGVYFRREVGDDGWQNIIEARLPDGSRLLNNLKFAKFFHKVASDMDGGVILEGGSGGVPGTSIDGRIEEIAKIMKTDWGRYSNDEGMRKEYAELLQRQEERNKRLGKA